MRRHIALLAALLAPTPALAVFPADAAWIPVPGGQVLDGANDATPSFLDLTGVATDPTVWWSVDATHLFFRVQVVANPAGVGLTLDNGGWGVSFDVDGVPTTFELLLEASTTGGVLQVFENTTGAAGLAPSPLGATFVGSLGTGEVRTIPVSASGGGSYLDVQVPIATMQALGILPDTMFRMGTYTRDPLGAGWKDVSGCTGLVACVAEDTTSDPVAIDADLDGLTFVQEAAVGSDPEDADTDDDGLTDGAEWFADTVLTEWDSDGDGLSDGLELGVTVPDADTLIGAGHFTADADPASTTDPEKPDTDGGGVDDGVEDWSGDGEIDTFETDPNDPFDDVDSDGDTIPDVFDGLNGNPVSDVDSDGDGLTDEEEFLYDTDEDGTPDFLDDDSDGDGIPDADEGNVDTDGDGVPDYLDEDSDDDGVPDATEGSEDTDGDTIPDYLDDDSDGDGIPDADEVPGDADGDGDDAIDDPDDNGDGVPDGDQLGDSDGDGTPDHLEDDTDGDGIPNGEEGTDDPDQDGDGNATDTDSDGDGKPDADEGTGDDDCDGIPNYQDPDDLDGNCDTGQPIPGVDTAETADTGGPAGGADKGNDGYGPGEFTGGACSSAPGAASFLPIALAALLLRRRRRAVVAVALAVAPAAGAQEVNAQRFSPNQDRSTFAKLQDADVGDAGEGGFGLWLGYTDDPLVFRPESGDEVPVVGGLATGWLTGSYSLGRLRIGGALPFHGGGEERLLALGDGQLGAEIAAFETGIFNFGVFGDASLPMGDPAASLGSGGLRGRGGLIGRLGSGPARLTLNLGLQSGTGRSLGQLDVSPAVIGGLGLSYELTDALSAAIEVDGEQWLGSDGASGARPAEWLASGQYATDLATFRLGAGSGLSQGIGAPDFRVIAGVLIAPDRIKPEPMPIADAEVPPPPPAPVVAPAPADASLVVRVISPNGEPIRGANVRVMGQAGDAQKAGPDGILETTVPVGAQEVVVSADGWTSAKTVVNAKAGGQNDVQLVLQPNSDIVVDAVAGRIYLQRKVFFEVDRAELTRESLGVLDRLVEVLVQRPEIQKIRVEGHTDSTGNDQHNLELSQARAQSVVNYLVKAGIAAGRLEATGFGETRPLQQGETPDILATNRRVEFHITKMGDQVTPGETEE